MSSVIAVVPAYQAERSVGWVVRGLLETGAFDRGVLVVDDGSTDATASAAIAAGAEVRRHLVNRGKGAALLTGLEWAREKGIEMVVTVDADGQHPAEEGARLAGHEASRDALVLGVRDLAEAGAPWPNRCSNGISNYFLSLFSGIRLRDTQCGLRRYPVNAALELGLVDQRFAFEAEVVLRAARRGWTIVQEPIRVLYPCEKERETHFDSLRDPWRIVGRVLSTLNEERKT